MALPRHGAQLAQVLDPARRYRIRELRQAVPAGQVHVLDLDVAHSPRRAFEQQVDAAALAIAHLAPQRRIAGERLDAARKRSANSAGSLVRRSVCWTIACTLARVFFTR